MLNKFRWALITFFLGIIIFLPIVSTIPGAKPIVGDITLIPAHPAPQSVVKFSVDISGDSISSVRIKVFECNKETGICHAPPQNISKRNVDGDTYEAKVTLKWDDVTSIKYNVEIKSDGEWIPGRHKLANL